MGQIPLPRRSVQRLMAAAVLIAIGTALAGCGGGGGINNFDPSDLLNFMDTKKKLPGTRKPVFPEGVPGVEQGVPHELYRENVRREQQEAAAAAAAAAEQQTAPPPPAETRPKRPAPKATRAQRSPRPAAAPPAAAQPAPPPVQQPSAPPPPQQPAQTPPPFPAPLPSGTFAQ